MMCAHFHDETEFMVLFACSDTRITQHFIQRHIKLVKNALKTEEFLQDLNSYCNVFDILDKIRRKCPGNL